MRGSSIDGISTRKDNLPFPKPIRKDYKVGQMLTIHRKDSEGYVRNVKVRIVEVRKYWIRVEIPTQSTPYYECILYSDLRREYKYDKAI